MSAAAMETDSLDESRTVVVSGVPDVLPDGRMSDKLTIHFQSRRRSLGGDVEVVTYPTNMKGVAFVTFDQAEDAERVVRKEQQIMTDPDKYLLTVFPFTRDVFFYVCSAKVDLSLFVSDHESLIESLQAAHRSIHFRLSPHKRKAIIEGPFAAIKALREDLMCRASQLKYTVPTGTVTLRESPRNPKVISHHEFAGSVSCSHSKAKQVPAGSNGLSALLQSTGEATEETQNSNSARQQVQRVCDPGTDRKEELKAGSRLRLTTEYDMEQDKSKTRQMSRQERNPGIRSPSPGLYLHHTAVDDISQKHTRTNTIPPTRASRGNTYLDSRYSSADYVKESYQNTSADTNNTLKDVSLSSESSAGNKDLSAGRPEDAEDTCIWVDSNILRYIEKCDKTEYDRCLRGVNASVREVEGCDLVQICLAANQPSRASLRIQQACEMLKTLVECWQSILRVHEICFKKGEHPKHKLIQICKDANIADMYNDVLYIVEDSRIIVIGPSTSSYLFHKRVERSLNTVHPP